MADSKKYGRTANLFDYQTMEGTIKGYYLDSNGDLQESPFAAVTDYIPCSGGKFCLAKVGGVSTSICLYDNNKHFLYGQAYNTSSGSDKQTIVVNSSINASYIRFTYFYTAAPQDDLSTIMLNAGSTALPYQPYIDWLHSLRKLTTATDTITTLPADLYADGNNATVGLVGNMSQTGTPTPSNPIQPSETGERTGNLANMYGINATGLNLTFKTDSNMTVKINGTKQDGTNIRDLVHPNIMLPAGKYTVKIKMIGGSITNITGGVMFGINKSEYGMRTTPQVNTVGQIGTRTFTLNSDTLLTSLDITPSYSDTGAIFNDAVFQCWLYSGDGDVPYEPYGYKIPISSANTTTPVYLGEVQTTRKIKKCVFTGEETFNKADSSTETGTAVFSIRYDAIGMEDIIDYDSPMPYISYPVFICSHFKMKTNTSFDTPYTAIKNGEIGANSVAINTYNRYVIFASNQYTTAADFKAYLAAQYAAGTPVCVWYVLATPQTAVVNEPLRKIGDYADTVSGITIPTITGKDTFDVLTSLKPSEVSLTYTGWHDASVKEWGGSEWQ